MQNSHSEHYKCTYVNYTYKLSKIERKEKMLKLLKNLNKTEVIMIAICLIFIIGQVWLDLKLPDYMSEITKLVQTER